MKYRELTVGVGALAFVAAATYAGSAQSPAPMMDGPAGAMTQDASFVRTVQMGNDDEISQARYILGETKNPVIRMFANRMIADHSTANVELLRAARNAHVPVPQAMRRDDRMMAPDTMRGMAEPALDTSYMKAEVDGHSKMLATVKMEEKSGMDPALKAYAANLEPTVQKHFDDARNIVALGSPSGAAPAAGAPATAVPVGSSTAPGALTPNSPATVAPSPSGSGAPVTPPNSSAPPAAPPTHAP